MMRWLKKFMASLTPAHGPDTVEGLRLRLADPALPDVERTQCAVGYLRHRDPKLRAAAADEVARLRMQGVAVVHGLIDLLLADHSSVRAVSMAAARALVALDAVSFAIRTLHAEYQAAMEDPVSQANLLHLRAVFATTLLKDASPDPAAFEAIRLENWENWK